MDYGQWQAYGRAQFGYNKFAEILLQHGERPLDHISRHFRNGVDLVFVGESHESNARHRLTRDLVAPLRRMVGIEYISLELEHTLQPIIDAFLQSGNPQLLERVIERERWLVGRDLPLQGRIDGDYFDILPEARRAGARVLAVDEEYDDRVTIQYHRDEGMASRIPKQGRGLFYCGEMHLTRVKELIYAERPDINIYLLAQLTRGVVKDLVMLSDALRDHGGTQPLAIEFKDHPELVELLRTHWYLGGYLVNLFGGVIVHP